MKIIQAGAHIDQMLRQTRAHHVQLSAMADVKANMLLTMSSVVLTVSAPYFLKPGFQLPVGVLIFFCLGTIVLAAYAAMPKFRMQKPSTDFKSSSFNLLFFGDFTSMTFTEFEGAMEEVINDPSQVYQMQVREIYLLGRFLAAKKYRFLRMAYVSFISGLLSSGLILVATELARK